jgi:CrcB protein
MLDWRSLLAVAAGGGIGSLLRYLVGFAVIQRVGPGFPWGTLLINVSGCLAIGFIAEVSQARVVGLSPQLRLFLTVGVLGGYTTFSTFAYEALTLLGERVPLLALSYAAGSVVAGLAAAFAGVVLARALAF